MPSVEARIDSVKGSAFQIPTDRPESDGTLAWSSTTLVLAEVTAAGEEGIGYTYANPAAGSLIATTLHDVLEGRDAFATGECWTAMTAALRNQGGPGLAAMAVAAVDSALWDLKGRILDTPVAAILGTARPAVDVYGSGGFTSYSDGVLRDQLEDWADSGIGMVKMKIGRAPEDDMRRMAAARQAVGEGVALMVDANGAFSRKQALNFANAAADLGVTWLEEPVSSEDLQGLRLLRDRVPAPIEIAAGEYGFDCRYFRRMLEAGAVDVLQVDGTRCGGITGVVAADALAQAFETPLSAHCAPSLHRHPGCAAKKMRHIEWFHDHVRIEQMLFDGAPRHGKGKIAPDLTRPGLGLDLRRPDAARYQVRIGRA